MKQRVILSPKDLVYSQSRDFYNLCLPLLTTTDIGSIVYYRIYKNNDQFHYITDENLNRYMLLETKGRYVIDYALLDAAYSSGLFSKNRMYILTGDVDNNEFWAPLYNEL